MKCLLEHIASDWKKMLIIVLNMMILKWKIWGGWNIGSQTHICSNLLYVFTDRSKRINLEITLYQRLYNTMKTAKKEKHF